MSNKIYVLNEVNTGIKMGMDAISNISPKIKDTNFKNELLFQYDKYNDILNDVNSELNSSGKFPSDLNSVQKAIGWMGVEIQNLEDNSTSNMAQMMIKGSNMGVINGVKLLNQNPDLEVNVRTILNKFIQSQQNNIEQLKKYL